MFCLLVGDVSVITISSACGGESGDLLLFLEDLVISFVDLCRQKIVREFDIRGYMVCLDFFRRSLYLNSDLVVVVLLVV